MIFNKNKNKKYIYNISFEIYKYDLINLLFFFLIFLLNIHFFLLFIIININNKSSFYWNINNHLLFFKTLLNIRILRLKLLRQIYLTIKLINKNLLNNIKSSLMRFEKAYNTKVKYWYIKESNL